MGILSAQIDLSIFASAVPTSLRRTDDRCPEHLNPTNRDDMTKEEIR